MAHIYKYALLKATPDPRRGERVNVGIVVFRDNAVDVRFSDVAKLRALSSIEWDSYFALATERMNKSFDTGLQPEDFIARYSILETVIKFSELAWFSASSPDEYEQRIGEIVDVLIRKPKAERESL